MAAIVDNDSSQLSDSITFDSHAPFDVQIDRTNLQRYLQRNVKVAWLYDILEAADVNEFGLNLEDQSSLNFVLTIGTDTSSGFQIYGESDQRYKVRGGNHQIVAALADQVSNRISLGYQLTALDQQRKGPYVLTFATCTAVKALFWRTSWCSSSYDDMTTCKVVRASPSHGLNAKTFVRRQAISLSESR